MREYYEDDRLVIPEYIKEMSLEELDTDIAKMEQELRERKEREKQVKVAAG